MSAAANSRAFDYLDHMLEAITLAMSFTEGMAKPDFLADRKTQQAVIGPPLGQLAPDDRRHAA